MKKSEQSANVAAVRAYLEGIGHVISSVQGYEVVARSLGHKSKHVLAHLEHSGKGPQPRSTTRAGGLPATVVLEGVIVPVLALDAGPLSVPQMRALNWEFDHIVPIALDDLWHIDTQNEAASLRLTGSDCALEDIGYEHVPGVIYGSGWAAYRVTGCVTSPEDHFEEVESADDEVFYADLLELANGIVGNAPVTVTLADGQVVTTRVKVVHAGSRQLLQRYARTKGVNNDAFTLHWTDLVFECAEQLSPGLSSVPPFLLHELKYASKTGTRTWHVSRDGGSVMLGLPA